MMRDPFATELLPKSNLNKIRQRSAIRSAGERKGADRHVYFVRRPEDLGDVLQLRRARLNVAGERRAVKREVLRRYVSIRLCVGAAVDAAPRRSPVNDDAK